MDRGTVAVYEQQARRYRDSRRADDADRARALAQRARPGARLLDAGCGPGLYLPALGPGAVGVDAALAMVREARGAGRPPVVVADLLALPVRAGSFGGAWARKSFVHLRRAELPRGLAELHRALAVDAPVSLELFGGGRDGLAFERDDFPGRFFSGWTENELHDLLAGGGYGAVDVTSSGPSIRVEAVRARTLADTVGAGMEVLFCGLNPSLHAADAGYGYAGPGNRFWPALEAVGVWSGRPDPLRLLERGLGMTDLVKRATPRAAALSSAEYRDGAARVERLVAWLRPGAVCFVGLSGYRAAVDRRARPGWQDDGFGGVATYVMPSTSGLNARTSLADLVGHLRAVSGGRP